MNTQAKESKLQNTGWSKMPMKLIMDATVSGSDLKVYATINMIYRKYKNAYPSLTYLSDLLGMSYVTVSRSLNKLKDKGYVTIKRNGVGKNNSYTISPMIEKEVSA